MKTFLHYVAQDIIDKYGTDLSRVVVVFPNKRASLFLNEELARCAGRPIWAPTYLTISDLFRRYSTLTIGDPIKLVCELHKSYVSITGKDETLDHFFEWGKLLISDFDDVDKNMADSNKVFANIANLHEYDDVSYLTDEQKKLLQTFFANFSEEHNSKLKDLFLSLWNKLDDIYNDFKKRLIEQGVAYEGMLYRDVIDGEIVKIEFEKYIFVGFNVLQRVEQRLFNFLKSEGWADFYWDYDKYYTAPRGEYSQKESGKYISEYLDIYGDAFSKEKDNLIHNNFVAKKNISFLKAKTENIQARFVSEWLMENDRYKAGKRTAIVMCDESLLKGIIHCIPEKVENINITTGYPLAQTPVASFVAQLLDMRIVGIRRDGGFRISHLRQLLNHPYARLVSEKSEELVKKLNAEKNLYSETAELLLDESLGVLFGRTENNSELLHWLMRILTMIADKDNSPLYQESVFNMYTITNRLAGLVDSGELDIDKITLQRLIKQLIASESIPFHGEPAIGIQIMGVLETRNLDFDNLLILSCNEGNMPKGIRDSSFIPYSIRKAYGLTTVDNKVAIYSYYFHRLLQRAKDISIVYNTSTENGNRGEMSRFMLQLMVESGHQINIKTLHADQNTLTEENTHVEKTEKIMDKLYTIDYLSPTALNRYLLCQLKFYYNYILGIKEPEDDLEDGLTSRAFGNVFHNTSEEIYKEACSSGRMVTGQLLGKLSERSNIERLVDRMLKMEIYGKDESKWRKINYNGMQLISREVLIRYIKRLLDIDKRLAPFSILALEEDVFDMVTVPTSQGDRQVKVGGRIDRLDTITDKETGCRRIRVIDYKTGAREISRPVADIADIFDPLLAGDEKHTDYYLQSMLYSLLVRNDTRLNPENTPVSPSLIFIQRSFSDNYDPTIVVGKEKVLDIKTYADEYKECLHNLVLEIFNREIPFSPTSNGDSCKYCPYTKLCGKSV